MADSESSGSCQSEMVYSKTRSIVFDSLSMLLYGKLTQLSLRMSIFLFAFVKILRLSMGLFLIITFEPQCLEIRRW